MVSKNEGSFDKIVFKSCSFNNKGWKFNDDLKSFNFKFNDVDVDIGLWNYKMPNLFAFLVHSCLSNCK